MNSVARLTTFSLSSGRRASFDLSSIFRLGIGSRSGLGGLSTGVGRRYQAKCLQEGAKLEALYVLVILL